MAKPRVFISSTFYDLKQIREDLERSIKELGYEPVRNETGSIAYGKDSAPESYAYQELELCDIIVCIIGGRYGTDSRENEGYSITQTELKTALDRGIQVFIFIERSVYAEFETYRLNKGNSSIKYRFVDDIKVYDFVENIYKLPKNNPIASFEVSADITDYLKVQWAGLFQRYLQDQKRHSELKILDEMKSVSSTLNDLVKFLTEERKNKDEAIKNILLANHPAFRRMATILEIPYRLFFSNREELAILLDYHGLHVTPSDSWRSPEMEEWVSEFPFDNIKILINVNIFDKGGRLKVVSEDDWSDDWIVSEKLVQPRPSRAKPVLVPRRSGVSPKPGRARPTPSEDDDIPF